MSIPSPTETPTLRAIFDAHAGFVLRVLRRLGVREADVEDMGQEVFVVVHRKLPQYEASAAVRSWLYGIARRVAADYRARAHIRRETAADTAANAAVGEMQHARVEHAELRRALDDALEQLDDPEREVFVLYELEELSMTEVADVVGCPAQTAYSRLHRAREQVARRLRRAHGSPRRML